MKLASLSLAAISVAVMSAPSAFAEDRDFDLPEFDRIQVSSGVKLIANVGEEQSITVETKNGDYSDFEIKVKNGELSVSREWNRLSWHSKRADYKVTVSVPSLNGFGASSGSHARVTNVDSQKFDIDLSSGAYVEIAGNCESCSLDLSSGANLDGKELICESAKIDVSSGGHGAIVVRESVVADASSGGHVSVYGNPTRVNVDKSSGGRIKLKSAPQASRD